MKVREREILLRQEHSPRAEGKEAWETGQDHFGVGGDQGIHCGYRERCPVDEPGRETEW